MSKQKGKFYLRHIRGLRRQTAHVTTHSQVSRFTNNLNTSFSISSLSLFVCITHRRKKKAPRLQISRKIWKFETFTYYQYSNRNSSAYIPVHRDVENKKKLFSNSGKTPGESQGKCDSSVLVHWHTGRITTVTEFFLSHGSRKRPYDQTNWTDRSNIPVLEGQEVYIWFNELSQLFI